MSKQIQTKILPITNDKQLKINKQCIPQKYIFRSIKPSHNLFFRASIIQSCAIFYIITETRAKRITNKHSIELFHKLKHLKILSENYIQYRHVNLTLEGTLIDTMNEIKNLTNLNKFSSKSVNSLSALSPITTIYHNQ